MADNTTITISNQNWEDLVRIKLSYCGRKSNINDVITLLIDTFHDNDIKDSPECFKTQKNTIQEVK